MVEGDVYIYQCRGINIPVEHLADLEGGRAKCKILLDQPGFDKGEERLIQKDDLVSVDEDNEYGLSLLFENF